MRDNELEEQKKETERLLAELREKVAGTWYNRDEWKKLAAPRPGWFRCRTCGEIVTFEKVPNKPCPTCGPTRIMYEFATGKRKPRGFHLSDEDRQMWIAEYDELMKWCDENKHSWGEE